MLTNDNVFSVFLLIVCAGAWKTLTRVPELSSFFPKVVVVLLAIFVLIQLVIGIINHKQSKIFDGDQQVYMFIMLLGMILYAIGMKYIGFLYSSILFMTVFFWLLGKDRTFKGAIRSTIFAVIVASGFFIVFAKIFLVPLPKGIWL